MRPCINDDESCEPGTMHPFPDPGDVMELTCDWVRFIGDTMGMDVTPGTRVTITDECIEEAHQVGATLNDAMSQHFWVDVDDDIKEIA